MTAATGKPRGRPRKDGLPSGSVAAREADKRVASGGQRKAAPAAVRGAPALSGPNAAVSGGAKDRGGNVVFSLPKNPGEIAETAIAFLETLTVPEGPLAGQPVKLADFQKRFVRGSLAPDVMIGILSIGRGNSKTSTSAGLALGSVMGIWDSQPKREILLCARNRDQARTAFQFVVGFVQGLPEDEQSILGGAPTLAIMDERAAWERDKGDGLENAILSGLGKRGGRALIISTSAPDDTNTFARWLDEPPPGTYVQEHRPPPGLPADDLESLLIANPGSAEGIGANPEWLVAQARRAIARGGSALSSFRNLNRNERCNSEDRSMLVTIDEWLSAEVAPDELPPRDGPCVLGVDLGGSRSMSAAAFYWPDTGRLEALGTFPSFPSLADRGASDGVSGRYVEMQERGELSVMGENTVPPGMWLAQIVRQLDGAEVACIVGDRFRHAEFSEAMQAAGLGRVPFIWRGFGWKDGSEDIERFRRALFDGEGKAAPSLLLRSAFADAITLVDPANNHKLAKARSLGRIDAAAASVLAVAEGARRKAAPKRKARVAWA